MEQKTEALETPSDAGEGKPGIVSRWLMEWNQASKREKDWRGRAREVNERYRGEKKGGNASFNILWANTEILRPAIYNSTPRPDVRRRNKDADQTSKQVAEVIERALSFCLDNYDFDYVMNLAVLDELLPGRAVTRIRYSPKFIKKQDEKGVEYDALAYADVLSEAVTWDCFRHGMGRNWGEVPWIGFEHRLVKEEFVKKWPKFKDKITLDYDIAPEDDGKSKKEHEEVFKRCLVYEIWDKDRKEVVFIAPSIKDEPLEIQKDPMGLQGFFPVPRPLMALDSTDTMIPVEEYRLYKDQAEELDRVTRRINRLINGLKLRGIYDATIDEFSKLMNADDNAMIPTESATIAMQAGGLDKAIWMMPIEPAAMVLKQLYMQREQLKQVIYEITGISDVLRGSTDPDETLGAQQLKAQNGSMRIARRQKEVQRYIRDLLRMKAEVIAEKFTPETLQLMTGIQITPEMMAILKQDTLRSFRIDIETDSTIASDQNADRQQVTELIEGIGGFVQSVAPAVESGAFSMETAKKILLASVRRFKFGREVEDAIEQEEGMAQENAGMPPAPDPKAQAETAKAQAEVQSAQASQQATAQKAAADRTKSQNDLIIQQEEFKLKHEEFALKRKQMAMEAELMERKHTIAMEELAAKAIIAAQADDMTSSRPEA